MKNSLNRKNTKIELSEYKISNNDCFLIQSWGDDNENIINNKNFYKRNNNNFVIKLKKLFYRLINYKTAI